MKRLIYLIIPAMILASCGGGGNKADELVKLKKQRSELDVKIKELEAGKKETGKVTPVSVVTVAPKVFNGNIEVQSEITGDENVLATSQQGGIVKSILVHTGQKVSAGAVLAVLDAAAIEQQIGAATTQLNLAKTLYEKQENLWKQNIGTEVQLLSAKTQYESAQKNVAILQANRNMSKIVAPISGTVQDVKLTVGSVVSPGMIGIQIVGGDKLKATAMIGENYLGKVKVGDPVKVILANADDSMTAKVSFVGSAVNTLSRSFEVQVQLPNNGKLHPNMSCIMKIANYTNPSAIVVPVSVVQKTSEGQIVYVADGTKAKAVPVTTGRNSNGNIEVLSGLNAGDKVVTAGYEEMENGQNIIIQ
ncbi:efflux RND transporter periplasmic adaptor subunit [Flavipsychrobacter stenotrophus]|uniref:Efflux RND transporter periplasmic adaptor subunit n=1 Tax=Flavipsychrobacter stenotrophus TaxID=2077091 RepID=A0A2S7SVD9_9BACT|nr:efflux RND transporter periplasmic adaptor subunit [Flavipsychrobacter stenotrophus]PQJ10863.1 efflux RND transporter periplasmic adaptor subunit [Flavipsychrobacter stenotrophus]